MQQHTFRVNTLQLNLKFVNYIKSMFGKKEVKIIVEEIEPATLTAKEDKKINDFEVKRFLDHRKNHPSVQLKDSTDFNTIVNDVNL